MPSWWKRSIDLAGSVGFGGTLTPRPEKFAELQSRGVRITTGAHGDSERWATG